LLLPLTVRGSQLSVALDLRAGPPPHLVGDSVRSCAFVRLRGRGADPEGSHPLGPEGLALHAVDQPEPDVDELYSLLTEPGPEHGTSVRLAAVDLWDGLGLWLAVREPSMCRLLVGPPASGWWPSMLPAEGDGGTLLLLGDQGLAMVCPTGSTEVDFGATYPVAVRGYGPGGAAVAERLHGLLDQWLAAGRPSATGLRMRAYPPEAPMSELPPAATVLRKPHSRLVLDWPVNPVSPGPILER
jgi:protein-L-isoaspartate(D-aspartate) O-methyltransferase